MPESPTNVKGGEMPTRNWPRVYRDLGVKPVINAQSWVTKLGGSLMRPEVLQAMDEAATAFVDVIELNRAAGKFVAKACEAEGGLVTAGCAAAQVLMAAACMTGTDEARMERLPDTTGMKNEVVIFKGQRNHYDASFTQAGAKLVEFGMPKSAKAYQLEAAITERTCAVAYVQGPFLPPGIGLEETIRIAHSKGVPVIVDAAAEVPPRENLSKFVRMGADMVAFSGGKGIGGPQSAGLLVGKADLMEAAFMNSLSFDRPKAGIGRPMKVSKETLVGMVTALQLCLETDEEAEYAGWKAKSEVVKERLEDIQGLRVVIESDQPNRQGPQPVIYFTESWRGPSPAEVRRLLKEGDPSILVGGGGYGDEINVVMVNVQDGEEQIIADRLNEILRGK